MAARLISSRQAEVFFINNSLHVVAAIFVSFSNLKEAEHETYRNMYNYMVQHPEFLTKDNGQGLAWAKKDNYAFLMESSSIEYMIERNCEVTQIGDLLDEKGYGIAMRKSKQLFFNSNPYRPHPQSPPGCWKILP